MVNPVPPDRRARLPHLKFVLRPCRPARLRFRSALLSQCRLVPPEALAPRKIWRRALDYDTGTGRLAGGQESPRARPPRCADAGRMEGEPSAGRAPSRSRRLGQDGGGQVSERRPDRDLLRGRLSLRESGAAVARGWFHSCAKSGGLDFPMGERTSPTATRRETSHAGQSIQCLLGAAPPPGSARAAPA